MIVEPTMESVGYHSFLDYLLLKGVHLVTECVGNLLLVLDSFLGVGLDQSLGMPLQVGDELEGLTLIAFTAFGSRQ